MSHGYIPVQWNPRKKTYDLLVWLTILLYLIVFMVVSAIQHSGPEALPVITLLIRGFASLAFLMLTFTLSIGPLARLHRVFIPLLYNRRHLGVSTFIIALLHGALVIFWYHSFGVMNPIASIFNSPGSYQFTADFRFQPFGFLALTVLFVMAATSHDYWNTNLGAPLWKALHMGVYIAYLFVIVHIAFGAMQDEALSYMFALVLGSVILLGSLHISASLKSLYTDHQIDAKNWVEVCNWQDIANDRAIIVTVKDQERVAIFRYESKKLAAIANECQHQNGPLGEGRVIDGFITCPWHGYQYQPGDGRSPKPFTEKVATYELKLEGDRVWLNPKPLPAGTPRTVIEIAQVIAVMEPKNV